MFDGPEVITLYHHQLSGAKWLAARRTGYLADVPRLGKTRTLLRATELRGVSKLLVVCPAIVRTHWRDEAAVVGWPGLQLVVKSYEEIALGGETLRAELADIDGLVIDEVHRAKHETTQWTKLLLGRNGYVRNPNLKAIYVASGTPVSKSPRDIATVLLAVFPEVARAHGIGSIAALVTKFCYTRRFRVGRKWITKVEPGIKHADEFREILDEIMLRRTLDDIGIDVPPLDWQELEIDLAVDHTPAGDLEAQLMMGMVTVAELESDAGVVRERRALGLQKVAPVVTMLIEQLEDNAEQIVVFAQHLDVIEGLRRGLLRFNPVVVTGSTSKTQRDALQHLFKTDPKYRIFIGQNQTCQMGIDLSTARTAVLVEPDWTHDVNVQLGARVMDAKQPGRKCVAQAVVVAGTIDEAIIRHNIRESKMADAIGLGTL